MLNFAVLELHMQSKVSLLSHESSKVPWAFLRYLTAIAALWAGSKYESIASERQLTSVHALKSRKFHPFLLN